MTGVLARIGRNWRALSSEERLAGIAALALLLSMLLPWYRESETLVVKGQAEKVVDSLNAFEVYSFIEAAIFVVAIGVLVLLWARAERKAFHLPGGDGTVVMGAGIWVMFLIFYRQFDRPDRSGVNADVSVNWGIFIAFLIGALLAYAGYRIRAAHVPEPLKDDAPPEAAPPRPAPAGPPPDAPDDSPTVVARRPRPAGEDPFDGQLSFDEPAEYRPPPRRS
jgi:multisubunit Na+/H+ antiporter MnhB subunit